jgi:hypothetical protein
MKMKICCEERMVVVVVRVVDLEMSALDNRLRKEEA